MLYLYEHPAVVAKRGISSWRVEGQHSRGLDVAVSLKLMVTDAQQQSQEVVVALADFLRLPPSFLEHIDVSLERILWHLSHAQQQRRLQQRRSFDVGDPLLRSDAFAWQRRVDATDSWDTLSGDGADERQGAAAAAAAVKPEMHEYTMNMHAMDEAFVRFVVGSVTKLARGLDGARKTGSMLSSVTARLSETLSTWTIAPFSSSGTLAAASPATDTGSLQAVTTREERRRIVLVVDETRYYILSGSHGLAPCLAVDDDDSEDTEYHTPRSTIFDSLLSWRRSSATTLTSVPSDIQLESKPLGAAQSSPETQHPDFLKILVGLYVSHVTGSIFAPKRGDGGENWTAGGKREHLRRVFYKSTIMARNEPWGYRQLHASRNKLCSMFFTAVVPPRPQASPAAQPRTSSDSHILRSRHENMHSNDNGVKKNAVIVPVRSDSAKKVEKSKKKKKQNVKPASNTSDDDTKFASVVTSVLPPDTEPTASVDEDEESAMTSFLVAPLPDVGHSKSLRRCWWEECSETVTKAEMVRKIHAIIPPILDPSSSAAHKTLQKFLGSCYGTDNRLRPEYEQWGREKVKVWLRRTWGIEMWETRI